MGRIFREPISFERWAAYVFDHPAPGPVWHWDWEAEYWDGPAPDVVAYLTRTFTESDTLLSSFSDAQVDQGLYFLVNNACSNYMFALLDEAVPLPDRLHCIDSMAVLFATCLARRCPPVLSHLDEPGGSPLNSVCYMWWDVIPLMAVSRLQPTRRDGAALDRALLDVMRETLQVDSAACQESALHGLGHWSRYAADARAIIDDFLGRRPRIRPELRQYALAAREGCIQ